MQPRLAALLVLGSLTAAALRAQEQRANPPLPRVEVRCLDVEDKPVADAEVHVFQARKGPDGRADYVASGPHRTDAEGVARTAIAMDFDGGRFDRWFHARVPGKLVGAQRALRHDPPAPMPTIRMVPSREVRGRVQVPEGFAATSVRVRLLSLQVLAGETASGTPFPRSPDLSGLTRTLPDLFDAAVAEDGTFALRDLPRRMRLYLAAEGIGLAHTQWSNVQLSELRVPDVIELTMSRESSVEGGVVGPDGRAVPDAEVTVRLEGHYVRQVFEARSGPAGKFRVAGLPAGDACLEVTSAAGVMRPCALSFTAGEVLRVGNVALEVGIEVRGGVRCASDGAAVEGVGIGAITDGGHQWQLGWTSTNGEGRFVLRLPAGRCRLYVNNVPAGFQPPSARLEELLRLDVQRGDTSLDDVRFEIERAK